MAMISHAQWLDRFGDGADLVVDAQVPAMTYSWTRERRVSTERRAVPRVDVLVLDGQRRLAQAAERRAHYPR